MVYTSLSYLQQVEQIINLCKERRIEKGKKVYCDDLEEKIADTAIDALSAYMKASIRRDYENDEDNETKTFNLLSQLIKIRDSIAIYVRSNRKTASSKLFEAKTYIESIIGSSSILIY